MEEKNRNNIESLAAFLHSGEDNAGQPEAAVMAPEPKRPDIRNTASFGRLEPKQADMGNTASFVKPEPKQSNIGNTALFNRPEPMSEKVRKNASSNSLSGVLFSLDSKKKERAARLSADGEDLQRSTEENNGFTLGEAVGNIDSFDENNDAEEYGGAESYTDEPYYEQSDKVGVHYDNAATQMMDFDAPRRINTYIDMDEETEEEKEERREIAALKVRYEKQRLRSRTFAYILLGVFLSVVIVGTSAYISSYIVTFALDLTGIATNDFRIDVIIPENANTQLVAAILQENNIIKSAKFFKFFSEFTHKKENFQPGTYTLSSTMSYSTLFQTLQNQSFDYKTVTIRIVEGMTSSEIAKLLEENMVCRAEDFEQYYKNMQHKYDFELRVTEKSSKFNQLEGYLFPDTYEFYAILDIPEIEYDSPEDEQKAADKQRKNEIEYAAEAVDKIFKNFNSKITKQMYKQMGEKGLTLDEVITLASMVQKEAAGIEDMYYVASVFMNRLNNIENFPNLQSDVTVLYIENDIRPYVDDKSVQFSRYSNAYNTYVCRGIPAGPICNPGLDAINAVLDPAVSSYYFFCANSETGDVYYAETQEEHEANLVLAGLS